MAVNIDGEMCKGCGLCVYYCPMSVLDISDKMNRKGFSIAGVVDPDKCTQCKLCEINCPDFAIFVEEDEE